MSKKPTSTDNETLNGRHEIYIPINLKGLYDGYEKIMHEAPRKGFQWCVRKIENFSKKLMTGPLAVVTFPASIILRNSARATHHASNNRYGYVADVVGVVGAAGAWWMAGGAALSYATTSLGLTATVGKIGAMIGAAVVTAPVLVPAYTAGMIAGSLAIGGVVAAASLIPAVANLPVGLKRSYDAMRGVKLNAKDLEIDFDKTSLQSDYVKKHARTVYNSLERLDEDNRRKVFLKLSEEFGKEADPAPATEAQVAPAPKAKGSTPKPK